MNISCHNYQRALGYLAITDHDPDVTNADAVREAFMHGYAWGMRKTHTYDEILFVPESQLSNEKLAENLHARLFYAFKERYGDGSVFDLITDGMEYLSFWDDDESPTLANTLRESFIAGYQTAIHAAEKFDRALFLEGHMLVCEIMAGILSTVKSDENAARAAARIVASRYGVDKKAFRGMVTDERANDAGEPVEGDEDQEDDYDPLKMRAWHRVAPVPKPQTEPDPHRVVCEGICVDDGRRPTKG